MAAVWMSSFGRSSTTTTPAQQSSQNLSTVLLLRANEGIEGGGNDAVMTNATYLTTNYTYLTTNEGVKGGAFYQHLDRVLSGGFGWFHTGAAMEETQCFNQTFRYLTII